MAPKEQMGLVEIFQTSRPANPCFCHQEFLEKLAQHGRDSVGRRCTFLLQRLSIDARRVHYKTTLGVNKGWRRSRLGGNHGSHFYAWWVPKNALPLKDAPEFAGVPDGAVFLRDIRHHDDHSLLLPQSLEQCYLPVTVRELRRDEYGPAPWTQSQARFASARQPVRILKGHPGSGKTTALWNAADASGAQRVLYVTYSRDLAALARDYFDRFCSSHKYFQVVTFSNLIRQLVGLDAPVVAERESRQRFARDVAPFVRHLGPWAGNLITLYDEMYAHLVGDALPVSIGRFAASKQPRSPDKVYRERRTRFLGTAATTAALDTATRLDRLDGGTLADRYFPELALAWGAVERLRGGATGNTANIDAALLDFDCIAVDECQDLTPIEATVIVELASITNRRRRGPVPVLVAGDEAQTVRPTDFEWGWLSDLLHAQIGTPYEYKLGTNLRSPRRLAELVNRVWDLYSHIEKQERPSGTGQAEIEDDATDQIFYCTATPGPELNDLLIALSAREGLAMVTLDDAVPAYVPEAMRSAVLTAAEVKGLDFNSICVLDAGRHLEGILHQQENFRADSGLESLRKRLSIDKLRVALSRATERLLWVDVHPSEKIVRQSIAFLNGGEHEDGVSSSVPSALLKTLDEEELDAEARVQRCQADARQYLEVKPEMAWSRAQQAVTLLGRPGAPSAVADSSARQAAHLTLSEICFILALRNTRLVPELGRPDLFQEARRAAASAQRFGLAAMIDAVARVQRVAAVDRLQALADLAQTLPRNRCEIEPWLLVELGPKSKGWIEELESALGSGRNAAILLKLLPSFYEVLGIPDRVARTARLEQRAIQLLIKDKQYSPALEALRALAERQPKLEAVCHEGLGDFHRAAECYREAGQIKEALGSYRSIPDLDAALKLLAEIGEHPATDSLQWISRLQKLVAERPEKFTKVVTAAEKKLLEELLERSLGVTRRKTSRSKTVGTRKAAPRKHVQKRAAPEPF